MFVLKMMTFTEPRHANAAQRRQWSDLFLKTSQTTRHYMGYHQSNQMPVPAITVTERDLRDQFLPAYEAMQVNGTAWNGERSSSVLTPFSSIFFHFYTNLLEFTRCSVHLSGMPGGRAEAIMCSYAPFDGVPSCANKRLLQDILRMEWGSQCLIQSDCCDSISSIFSQHHYVSSEAAAVAAAFDAGTQLCFACGEAQIAALNQSLAADTVSMAQLDSALARLFLTRMRLGEFERGAYPHSYINTSVIDSQPHRYLGAEGDWGIRHHMITLPPARTDQSESESLWLMGRLLD